jgi:hypothetical protein
MGTRSTAGDLNAQFIAKLHHGRPDVIEELDLRHGLHAARGHADGAADDIGFGQRRIENAPGAEFLLQTCGRLENAALPFYFLEVILTAAVGHVFAEDDDTLVAGHFVEQRRRNHFHHGLWRAVKMRRGFEVL